MKSESSSVARMLPCQGRGRGFESRLSLQFICGTKNASLWEAMNNNMDAGNHFRGIQGQTWEHVIEAERNNKSVLRKKMQRLLMIANSDNSGELAKQAQEIIDAFLQRFPQYSEGFERIKKSMGYK